MLHNFENICQSAFSNFFFFLTFQLLNKRGTLGETWMKGVNIDFCGGEIESAFIKTEWYYD